MVQLVITHKESSDIKAFPRHITNLMHACNGSGSNGLKTCQSETDRGQ